VPTGYHRRAFSFLLYLGGDENDAKPWNVKEDGGELRVYPRLSLADQHSRINGTTLKNVESHIGDPTGRTDYTDITPQEGTLVIFKSEAICHQVMKTNRKRLVVVGWIHGHLNEYE
jgi:Rps23 Pro-64 3,4-dihydroxylase Tpa1-like proline 4-hydroxylase